MTSRRDFLRSAASAPLIGIGAASSLPMAFAADLKSITAAAKPISVEERRARIAKVQMLMGQRKLAALQTVHTAGKIFG